MEEKEENKAKTEVFSRVLRAGKRTYFFDLKETKNSEHYLTITESKRRFDENKGVFFYEKHKIFLHIKDILSFNDELNEVISFVQTKENGMQSFQQNDESDTIEKK